MSDFVIIPDAASDLPKELRDRFQVPDYIKGTIYLPDGSEAIADLDWELMSPTEYYTSMSGRKALYKTAGSRRGDIYEIFEKHLQSGKDILTLSLSSALSGTYQVYLKIAAELQEKYPDRKILIVDSLRYSTALALLIIKACQKQQTGATIEETVAYLEEIKHNIHQMGSMDDMFFLCKTGRVSNFKAFFGTLIGINAMADFNRTGLSQVVAKIKGKQRALDATIEYMRKTIIDPQDQIIFVAHSNREQAAQMLAQRIQEEFSPKEIIINPVGMSCGASIGPGLCAAFYEGAPISENMEQEQAIMKEIVANQKN